MEVIVALNKQTNCWVKNRFVKDISHQSVIPPAKHVYRKSIM